MYVYVCTHMCVHMHLSVCTHEGSYMWRSEGHNSCILTVICGPQHHISTSIALCLLLWDVSYWPWSSLVRLDSCPRSPEEAPTHLLLGAGVTRVCHTQHLNSHPHFVGHTWEGHLTMFKKHFHVLKCLSIATVIFIVFSLEALRRKLFLLTSAI